MNPDFRHASLAPRHWFAKQIPMKAISEFKAILGALARRIADIRSEIEELTMDLQFLGELPDLTFGRDNTVYEE